ncbi:MAG TPA: hypothetical protein P5076_10305, partial [Myxococcota bacterium]|nr:hypothetical protein [Myxococcota bacterium]
MSESSRLAGLKIVLTGDFGAYERDEATRVLEGLGADVTGSVSGKTQVVFAGKNPGATKLGQAKKRGLPVLGEAELVALIQGQALDELLAGAAAPAAAAEPPKPALPMPFVEPPPRDGEYLERFPGSDRVRVSGSYRAGLRHGSWKVYFESGQLREDYTWEAGLKHGPELDWTADGTKICDGRNERGKRIGTWTWWYPDGRFNQACTYDGRGLRQGEYRWDLEDGSPRARGAYLDDKYHGAWTWWREGAWEKLERAFDRGAQHGPEAAWFPGGQLALRRGFCRGEKHGLEEVFDPTGKLTYRGEWLHGQAVGEHLHLDEAGQEVRGLYVDGLPEEVRADAKGREKVLKKLKKAKDHYAKADALGERVEYGQRAAFLLHLWRGGHLDVPADPDLWELLCEVDELVRGEEVVAFLRAAQTKDAYATVLPGWPDSLDRLVMEVYAREPGPIDAARDSLPGPMRAGVALVQARFGKSAGDTLKGLLPALAAAHVERGLGPDIWWPGEGGLPEQRKLFLDYQGTRTELFDRLLGFFGPYEDFVAELEKHAFREAEESCARVSFATFRPLVERATPEQLAVLISGISLDNFTQDYLQRALTEWRHDDGATLARIALEVKDTGLRKWPCVCVAILKLSEEGREIPPELLAALALATESPTSSSEWYHGALRELDEGLREDPHHIAARVGIGPGCAVPRTALLRRALARLP